MNRHKNIIYLTTGVNLVFKISQIFIVNKRYSNLFFAFIFCDNFFIFYLSSIYYIQIKEI